MKKLLYILLLVPAVGWGQKQEIVFNIQNFSDLKPFKAVYDSNYADSLYYQHKENSMLDEDSTVYFETSNNYLLDKTIIIKKKGVRIFQMETTNDTLNTWYYYTNGNIMKHDKDIITNTMPYRLWIWTEQYYKNGQLIMNLNPNNKGIQTMKIYYSNGQLYGKWQLLDQIIYVGKVEYWYENGQIKSQEVYQTIDTPIKYQSPLYKETKEGEWNYWDEYGNLTKTLTYRNDSLISPSNK